MFNATSDFQIKENDTYQPGVRISNYVCYPGGGAWVRWDHTKEVDYVWSNRLEPAQEGNSVDEIESRTDHIEKHNWVQLDEAVLGLTAQVPVPLVHPRLSQIPLQRAYAMPNGGACSAFVRPPPSRSRHFSDPAVALERTDPCLAPAHAAYAAGRLPWQRRGGQATRKGNGCTDAGRVA